MPIAGVAGGWQRMKDGCPLKESNTRSSKVLQDAGKPTVRREESDRLGLCGGVAWQVVP